MQIKTTHHYTPTRMAKIWNTKCCVTNVENKELMFIVDGNA